MAEPTKTLSSWYQTLAVFIVDNTTKTSCHPKEIMTRHVTISIPLQWAILPLIVFTLELVGARFLGVLYAVTFLSVWIIRKGVSFLSNLRIRKQFLGTPELPKGARSLSFMDRMSDVEKELLKKQISKLENYIIRDFIDSWSVNIRYRRILVEPSFSTR